MKTWVKLYTEINRDPDMATLTWAQRGMWAAMLALAGEIDDQDADGLPTGRMATADKVAWHLRCSESELANAVTALSERGMLAVDGDGTLRIEHFEARQSRPPSASREETRKRKQAERASRDVTSPSRGCHEGVTRTSRGVTSAEESRVDTDSDTETEKSRGDTDMRPPVAAAVSLWEAAAGRMISPVEAREILADAEDYPPDQIEYAIREAARQNVLRWAYVQGILRGGCKGLGRDRARASPPPPVQVLEGGAVILPYMGGSGSDNARRR
jgi:DnaD/phage-associated family protein